MEVRERNEWVIIIGILVILCCCVALVGAAAVTYFARLPFELGGVTDLQSERSEQSFEVGGVPILTVDSFAGSVTVRAGESGVIRAVAIKRVPRGRDAAQVEVTITERGDGLTIRTRKPSGWSNVSVQLEITAPADTRLNVSTGAGSIDVQGFRGKVELDTGSGSITIRDIAGEVKANSGAGSIDARGLGGTVRLETGAGSIDYEGTPLDDCRFDTGSGSIDLLLPADPDVEVDLSTGTGTITVDFDIDGRVSRREVRGIIGRGDQGTIYASTGAGSISLKSR
jgi:hypothetical protein